MRRFQDSDYPFVVAWLQNRGLNAIDKDLLSDVGFIDENACGFLYLTNSKFALIDCYITNPASDKSERLKSITQITQDIIQYAKTIGIKLLKADTKIKSILHLSSEFGFVQTGEYATFQKELT